MTQKIKIYLATISSTIDKSFFDFKQAEMLSSPTVASLTDQLNETLA